MGKTVKDIMLEIGIAAKSAAVSMNRASAAQKNEGLRSIAREILARRADS